MNCNCVYLKQTCEHIIKILIQHIRIAITQIDIVFELNRKRFCKHTFIIDLLKNNDKNSNNNEHLNKHINRCQFNWNRWFENWRRNYIWIKNDIVVVDLSNRIDEFYVERFRYIVKIIDSNFREKNRSNVYTKMFVQFFK